MNTVKKIKWQHTVGMVLAMAGLAGSAQAAGCDLSSGGFVAGLIQCAAPGTPVAQAAQTLDTLNGQMGRPFDHAVAAAVNSYVPGSQAVIEEAWRVQRQLPQVVRMPVQPNTMPVQMGRGVPVPGPMPTMMTGYGGPMCVPGYWAPGPMQPIWVPPVCS